MAYSDPINGVIPKDNGFVSKMSDQILEFWNYNLYTDVIFAWRCCVKRVKAHQIVLAASSIYFQSLFSVIPGEKKLIYIDDIFVGTFYELVKYCYTGELVVNALNADELLRGARIMKLKGAIDICLRYMHNRTAVQQSMLTPPTTVPKIAGMNTTATISQYIPYVAGKRNDDLQWPRLLKGKGSSSPVENVITQKQWGPKGFQKNSGLHPKIPSAFNSFTFSPSISTDIRNMFSSSQSVASSNETSESNWSRDSTSPMNPGDKFVANIESSIIAKQLYEATTEGKENRFIGRVDNIWAY
uniref:Mapotge' protein n=1 Tax=Ceratitis capitata TaxID=7213 RepID=Q86Q27_CERCA|nr:mapotge' protein [Ceratitis capitata]